MCPWKCDAVFVEKPLQLLRQPYAQASARMEEAVRTRGEYARKHAPLTAHLLPALDRVARNVAVDEAQQGMLRIAVELERWKRKVGAYPDSLDRLAIPLPLDTFTGAAFAYTSDGRTFSLRSAGHEDRGDGADDGLLWRRGN